MVKGEPWPERGHSCPQQAPNVGQRSDFLSDRREVSCCGQECPRSGGGMRRLALFCAVLIWSGCLLGAEANNRAELTFSCSAKNDLYLAISGSRFPRFETALAAIQKAPTNSGVLILADEYPEHTTTLEPGALALAQTKHLRLFIEYPGALPGLEIAAPRTTAWERLIVSSEKLGPSLPRLHILTANECHYVPVTGAAKPDLVVARIAGYDTAVFGIPRTNAFPILFEVPERNLIVSATKLSGFVTGRYAPARDWRLLWQKILFALDPNFCAPIRFKAVVEPAYAATARLPRGFQREAFNRAAEWFGHSHLLVNPGEKPALYKALAANSETTAPAQSDAPKGDGSLGILEGYASGILPDGNQLRRLPLRADCNAESAMVFGLDAVLNQQRKSGVIASNLLDFVYFKSGMCQGARADPRHPAFGLIGWGDIAPAWLVANYGDDNARAMLATAVVAASLKSDRWDEALCRALLANFRTTGKLGFRGDRIDLPSLEKNGWKHFHEAETMNFSPHFESYLWACYLWGYRQTGFRPFLDRAKTAIGMTMKVYPAQWRWQDNLERAHMLLCLAWWVRVEDIPEHRQWLGKVATDLLADQQPSGSIHERLAIVNGGHYRVPQRNEDYGTTETPLLQQNGDPVSDQLYTTGFALLGLHEAVGATGDRNLKRAEDKLAEFLVRVQTRSKNFSYLNGTWFRAFDDRLWEPWASSADVGWGAWSLESGWGQALTAAVLGLREKRTTVWEFTAKSRVRQYFEELKSQLSIED